MEHGTWLLLGEAVSKTEHIAGVPLSPEAAQRLHMVFLAKGALATTAIEGNTLYERFGKGGASHERRRRLVLDLADAKENQGWVSVGDLPDLSPRLARAYAGKTQKTISRDLNELARMNLILRKGRKVKANKTLILAFLPARAGNEG